MLECAIEVVAKAGSALAASIAADAAMTESRRSMDTCTSVWSLRESQR
jgi:hypothetical protein